MVMVDGKMEIWKSLAILEKVKNPIKIIYLCLNRLMKRFCFLGICLSIRFVSTSFSLKMRGGFSLRKHFKKLIGHTFSYYWCWMPNAETLWIVNDYYYYYLATSCLLYNVLSWDSIWYASFQNWSNCLFPITNVYSFVSETHILACVSISHGCCTRCEHRTH